MDLWRKLAGHAVSIAETDWSSWMSSNYEMTPTAECQLQAVQVAANSKRLAERPQWPTLGRPCSNQTGLVEDYVHVIMNWNQWARPHCSICVLFHRTTIPTWRCSTSVLIWLASTRAINEKNSGLCLTVGPFAGTLVFLVPSFFWSNFFSSKRFSFPGRSCLQWVSSFEKNSGLLSHYLLLKQLLSQSKLFS